MSTYRGRTFDWKAHHDPRSRRFNVADVMPKRLPTSKFWTPPTLVLDQGQEGACVGFGCAAEAGASPFRVPRVNNDFARGIYNTAKTLDEWPGEDYEGTSVLAGMKAMQQLGLLSPDPGAYRWSFSPDDMRESTLGLGPCVIGIPYKEGMFHPRPSGLLECTGAIAGGHCMCVIGYHPHMRLKGEGFFKRFAVYKVRQSWGADFGRGGDVYITEEDMADLTSAANQGECAIPMHRLMGRTTA
jgi:hypothetical protein